MYTVVFSPVAAGQYADLVARFAPYKKKLEVFEREIEQVIRQLESMSSSYPPKGTMLAARLRKSEYYLFFRIHESSMRVTIVLIISQKQNEKDWPTS